jgi:hypothetical protein
MAVTLDSVRRNLCAMTFKIQYAMLEKKIAVLLFAKPNALVLME